MGDILLTTPVIKILREARPQSQIDFLIEKPFFEILSGNPYLDNILLLEEGFFNQLCLIRKIRKEKYDVLFDFLGNPRTAWISFFSKAQKRIGFDFQGRRFAYNVQVKRDRNPKYVVDFKLDALRVLGIRCNYESESLCIAVPSNARAFAGDFFLKEGLNKEEFIVGISPTSRRQARIWRKEYFAQFADTLIQEYNAKIILFWGPGERAEVQKISSLMRNKSVIIPEAGIKQLAALIGKCNLLVSNDNGTMHIAVAMGVPTITIYGPTQSECWNSALLKHQAIKADISCTGCNRRECSSMECMEKVTPQKLEEVFLKMKDFIPGFMKK